MVMFLLKKKIWKLLDISKLSISLLHLNVKDIFKNNSYFFNRALKCLKCKFIVKGGRRRLKKRTGQRYTKIDPPPLGAAP